MMHPGEDKQFYFLDWVRGSPGIYSHNTVFEAKIFQLVNNYFKKAAIESKQNDLLILLYLIP
jgi:hypothetical protein